MLDAALAVVPITSYAKPATPEVIPPAAYPTAATMSEMLFLPEPSGGLRTFYIAAFACYVLDFPNTPVNVFATVLVNEPARFAVYPTRAFAVPPATPMMLLDTSTPESNMVDATFSEDEERVFTRDDAVPTAEPTIPTAEFNMVFTAPSFL
jgi:hypothetical protein